MKFSDQDKIILQRFTQPIGEIVSHFSQAYPQKHVAEKLQELCLALYWTKHEDLGKYKLEDVMSSEEKLSELLKELCPDADERNLLIAQASSYLSAKSSVPKLAFPKDTLAAGVPNFGTLLQSIGAVTGDQKDLFLAMQGYSRSLLATGSPVSLERPWIKNKEDLKNTDSIRQHLSVAQSLDFCTDLAVMLKNNEALAAIQTIAYQGYLALATGANFAPLVKVQSIQLGEPLEASELTLDEAYDVLSNFQKSLQRFATVLGTRIENVSSMMPNLVDEDSHRARASTSRF